MSKKEDRRVQMTKMILKESLLDILKEKPLSKISISEVCRVADINRNTFYNYYNTPQDILEEMEDGLYEKLAAEVKGITDVNKIILASCRTLEQNKKMGEFIFSELGSSRLLLKLLDRFTTSPFKDADTHSDLRTSLGRLTLTFCQKGACAIIEEWVTGGFVQSAETIAGLVAFLVENAKQAYERSPIA